MTTSALRRSPRARMVKRSGFPGPAPTMCTLPGAARIFFRLRPLSMRTEISSRRSSRNSRIARAAPGCLPPVDTASVNPLPSTTAGDRKVLSSGESATFTGMPRRLASRKIDRFTRGSEVAAKTIAILSRCSSRKVPSIRRIMPRFANWSTGVDASGATTVTRAPRRRRERIFRKATRPAPTTRAGVPSARKKIGR